MCEKSPTQGFVLSRIKRAYVSIFDLFSYRLLNKILIKPLSPVTTMMLRLHHLIIVVSGERGNMIHVDAKNAKSRKT